MLHLNGKTSLFDNALFLWHGEGGDLVGLLGSHIDDFFYSGNPTWHTSVVESIANTFQISSKAKSTFKYLVLDVVQVNNAIYVDQIAYIDNLVEINIDDPSNNDRRLNDKEKSLSPILL